MRRRGSMGMKAVTLTLQPNTPPQMPARARKRPRTARWTVVAAAALVALGPSPAAAIWPFPHKRFAGNALIGAGSLGLDDDGRVVAFGDFNGDQLYSNSLSRLMFPY